MREGTRNFIVGLVSIIAVISFAVLLFMFGELDRLFNPRYPLTLLTENAAGLRPGGAVEFSGVPVGVVDVVATTGDPEFPVRVIALINNRHDIPSNVEPFAATPLIGGSSRLQLDLPADQNPAAPFPKNGTAEIRGQIRFGLFEQVAAQLDSRLKPIIESVESVQKLSTTYDELGKSLNALLQPQTQAQLEQGEPPNIHTAVNRLNVMLDDAHDSLELVKKWLGDEQLYADVREAVAKANTMIERASEAFEKVTKLAGNLDAGAADLLQNLLPVTDELAGTLEDVRRVMRLALEGKGTMGQLLNNPDLYNSLSDAAIRLERTLVEAQLLIQKLRAEGVRLGL